MVGCAVGDCVVGSSVGACVVGCAMSACVVGCSVGACVVSTSVVGCPSTCFWKALPGGGGQNDDVIRPPSDHPTQ